MKKLLFFISLLIPVLHLQAQENNLLPIENWTEGSGSVSVFGQNGSAPNENVREKQVGPHGNEVIIWKGTADASNGADGGWNAYVGIDHTKTYRYTVWMKKPASNCGRSYFGTGQGTRTLNLSGTTNGNPYFWHGYFPQLDKWYLLVGYVHGSGHTGTTSYGGVYDGVTGEKVVNTTDFKNATSATTQGHRSYLYYCTTAGTEQYFYAPRIEEVNGNEPTIGALLGGSSSGGSSSPIWTKSGNNIYYNSGNVGIGINNPTRKLHINGTGEIGLTTSVTTNTKAGLYWYTTDNYSISRSSGTWAAPNYQQLKLNWGTGIILEPGTGDNAGYGKSYVEITKGKGLRVSQGTVGIGIEDPGEFKLAVNGDVKAKKVKVTPDNWSDFVFEEDYKLPTLEEVEIYIQNNKHLPNIPTEKEVLKDGVFLDEMDAKLLQKIEELTLYIIEQDKQISKLELLVEKVLKIEEQLKK